MVESENGDSKLLASKSQSHGPYVRVNDRMEKVGGPVSSTFHHLLSCAPSPALNEGSKEGH